MTKLYVALLGALFATSAMAADAEVEALVSGRCSTCHGAKGHSTSPIFPSLAGQNQEYLVKQLQDFRSKKRVSETMAPQAADLSDKNIAGLAAFFANQPAKIQRVSDTDLVAVGRYIYTKGNTWSGVPACTSCHGENAYGTATLPRLAGQNTRYLLSQLKDFNQRTRTNDNEAMHLVASRLTEMETQAVTSYLGQLP
ncbi:c-type cytochrome [Simplicispira psychrophila]|uniref:c-type cytochrome n=1 Tax=Simplicispira psychrophila TaxID=80882 RepID=UPI000564C022|nr:c-type cytochrome [Simplicispira psychrophila]